MRITQLVIIFILSFITEALFAQQGNGFSIRGTVKDAADNQPIEYAVVAIPEINFWATSNQKGEFILSKVPLGRHQIHCRVLGYQDTVVVVNVRENVDGLSFRLQFSTLALQEVTVTARISPKNIATTYQIDQSALQHMQLLDVGEISSLLPGGKTSRKNTLLSPSMFALRSEGGAELDNPTFGTGVEVDGVRLSTNATFPTGTNLKTYGVDTRNISSSNIESVEVITGVPSVEYGDISNGVVKINTRKGKSPGNIQISTNINTKQIAANKGFGLGEGKGILNLSVEHTKSIGDIASPYTSYQRNNVSIKYNNSFNRERKKPVVFTAGIGGSIGGMNSKHDPDAFKETFSRQKDNTLRVNMGVDWFLNAPWITNLSFSASCVYSDKRLTQKTNKSSSTSTTSIHGKNEGYFVATPYNENPDAHIVFIPRGYWYQTLLEDNRPLDMTTEIKTNWSKKIGRSLYNKIKAGAQYSASGNLGRGYYYEDHRLAPTWREYRYSDVPNIHNLALYAENKIIVPVNEHRVEFVGGVRADITSIAKSEYGTISSVSPRFNAMFQSDLDKSRFVHEFSVFAGWGKMVKLPSFAVLYPKPSYRDILTFAPGTTADGNTYYAYYTMPGSEVYNPRLRWQENLQTEIGVKATIGSTKISLSAFYNRTNNPYARTYAYSPFAYKFTSQSALENFPIPVENREYFVNQATGIVTVKDKTGQLADQTLPHKQYRDFKANQMQENGTPVHRFGVEWIVDFGKIKSMNTSFRLDGNYYRYKGTDERLTPATSSMMMANGEFYKYLGYYVGGSVYSNGSISRNCNTNLTVITHIPVVRLIVSLRIETSLYDFSRNLSEYGGKPHGFVIDSPKDYFPSETQTDIYAGNQYVGVYPEYYVSLDDMETRVPFAEKLGWAKENDTELFNELAKLVKKSNYKTSFNSATLSAYFSANINITKEIGKRVSLSFYAKNFLNNMALVDNTQTNRKTTLYNSGYIPSFYYGLTFRLKL